MTGELEPRRRRELDEVEYEDVTTLILARQEREKMSAAAAIAKRAGVAEVEWAWKARAAERDLGRMLNAARQAGDLAAQGGDRRPDSKLQRATLNDLGIDRRLAAHCVRLAEIPAETWQAWEADTGWFPSGRAVGAAAARWLEEQAQAREAAAEATRIAQQAAAEAARAAIEAARLRKEAEAARPVPPLTEYETDDAGLHEAREAVLESLGPEPPEEVPEEWRDQWRRTETAMDKLVDGMLRLTIQLERTPPVLPAAGTPWREVTALEARRAARQLTDVIAIWVRKLNQEYEF